MILQAPNLFKENVGAGFVHVGVDFYSSDFQLSGVGIERNRTALARLLPQMLNEQFFGPSSDYVGCIVRRDAVGIVIQEILRVLRRPGSLDRLPVTPEEITQYFGLMVSCEKQCAENARRALA